MKNAFRLTAFILALMITTSVFAQKEKIPKDKVLDKKVFIVELNEQGKKKTPKPVPDELSFTGNKIKSKVMTPEGYQPSLYTVEVDSTDKEFPATFASEGKGKSDTEMIKWNGTVTGTAIEGTVVIEKKGKTVKEYQFSGELKQKGAKKKE